MTYYKNPNVYAKKRNNSPSRTDRQSGQRATFEKNKKKILMSQDICGICGQPVDKNLKWPHPFSATVDHIIPVSKGGHPSDIENLQLAHNRCNRLKSDNLMRIEPTGEAEKIEKPTGRPNNRDLPLSLNWLEYNGKNTRKLREEVLKAESLEKTVFYEDIL